MVSKKLTRWLVSSLLLGAVVTGNAAQANSVQASMQQAIDNNPEVQAAWHEFLISKEDLNGVKAGYWPSLDLEAGYARRDQDFGNKQKYDLTTAGVRLTQMLFDGFGTSNEVKRFKKLQLASYYNLLAKIQDIALETAIAHADVLRYQKLATLADNNLQQHTKVYWQVKDKTDAGVGRAVDLEQINGRISLARSNMMVAAANLHDVSARYQRLVGKPPANKLDDMAAINELSFAPLKESLQTAYQQNFGFLAILSGIEASQFQIKSRRADYYPKLNLVARHGYQDHDDTGLEQDRSVSSIGVELNYNLFNGGATRASVRQARQRENLAIDERNRRCRNIRQQLQIAYNDMRKLEQQEPILNQHRLSSSRVRTAYKDQFNIGQRTLLDMLDAENEYFEASRAHANAAFDRKVAMLRILNLGGQLLKEFKLVKDQLPSAESLGGGKPDSESLCPAENLISDQLMQQDLDNDQVMDYRDACPDTPPNTAVDEQGCTLKLTKDLRVSTEIQFAQGSSFIRAEYDAEIRKLLQVLEKYPNSNIEIEGHTSTDGSSAYNQRLSESRAVAVVNRLVNKGIQRSRIRAIGYGESRPKYFGNSPEARRGNRRIEAVVKARYTESVPRD